jgi:dipeptidyl aminopeptidase/acylaminoacyl peptidase
MKPSNGVGAEELVLKTPGRLQDLSSDGKFVIYSSGPQEIWILPLAGERKPLLYLKSEFQKTNAQLSPDGRWLAYQSNESGRTEVVVQSFPNPSAKFVVSTAGGRAPRWRGDGKELFYISDRKLMSVVMRPTLTGLEPSAPAPVFEMPRLGGGGGGLSAARQPYDVTRDGQRFLLTVLDTEGPIDEPLTVVVNWAAALKK